MAGDDDRTVKQMDVYPGLTAEEEEEAMFWLRMSGGVYSGTLCTTDLPLRREVVAPLLEPKTQRALIVANAAIEKRLTLAIRKKQEMLAHNNDPTIEADIEYYQTLLARTKKRGTKMLDWYKKRTTTHLDSLCLQD